MPRLTTFRFPPYSYVTGRFPHPLRDPAGHRCPGPEAPTGPPWGHAWPDVNAYLWGIDLWNFGYYWEAHEAWEGVWHAVGRDGIDADLLKSLIKLAAAGVKAREGRPVGIARHARRARALIQQVARQVVPGASSHWGLDLETLERIAVELERSAADRVNISPAAVVRCFPWQLKIEDTGTDPTQPE